MQRMSGIATLTHDWDSRLIGTKTKLLIPEKTPNFRICENGRFLLAEAPITDTGLYGYDYAKRQSYRL